ncbi:MAG: ABC transporter ATP-binding protein [Anaerolineaceae bacterium]|nr:ABC transporter ATP-binding protein [Anaerolineaceae bacterium]
MAILQTSIQINSLSKTYRSGKSSSLQAVKELNLAVPAGIVFGFLGPNGAGKTTTIKMICSLIQPTTGSITVNGYDVWRSRSASMRQIGAVLEGTRNIQWALSAWDNLIYYGHLKGAWGKKLADRAEKLLREMELWDRRNDLVRVFSRGMQQKIAVACALIADPPIILLDEPTLGLDVQAARTVKNLVARLSKEYGKTVVLTTHQLDMAQDLCDRIAIISRGQVIADQPTEKLLGLFREEYYQIKVEGRLPSETAPALEGMTIEEKEDQTLLTGPIDGQASLYRLIEHLKTLKLTLLSVNQTEPNLEEVFIRLVDSDFGQKGEAK